MQLWRSLFRGGRTVVSCRMLFSVVPLALLTMHGGCPFSRGWSWDLRYLAAFKPLEDLDVAARLNFASRLIEARQADQLRAFARALDEQSPFGPTCELFSATVQKGEQAIQDKWPKGRIELRMATLSTTIALLTEDMDVVDRSKELLDEPGLQRFVAELRTQHPEQAEDLPEAAAIRVKRERGDVTISPDASVQLLFHGRMISSSKRLETQPESEEELVGELCKLEPLTMNVRLVYEVLDMAPGTESTADPVLSVEVVQHRFRFAGDRWEVPDEESE